MKRSFVRRPPALHVRRRQRRGWAQRPGHRRVGRRLAGRRAQRLGDHPHRRL